MPRKCAQIKAILFASARCVVAAEAVENEDEPNEVASAHATEIHAAATIQKEQKPDDIAAATNAVCTAVCKEVHYVPTSYIIWISPILTYVRKHNCVIVWTKNEYIFVWNT